jgi:pantetheine-phosphate adenylyltransferase
MANSVKAIYPGTFDPLTLGHEDIAKRASQMFDHVVIAVASAHHKKTLFTLPERIEITRQALGHLPNVSVIGFEGLVVQFALSQGAKVMVRGVRGVTDFDYEAQLAGMNRHMVPEVDSIFLTPLPHLQTLSSTLIREISSLGGEVNAWVSPGVDAALKRKLAPPATPSVKG